MPARFSAFGRVFSPSWPMTLAALVLLGVFVSLGRWQWQRGEAKQEVWAEYARNAPATRLDSRGLLESPRFSRIEVRGRFDPEHQFLLDNRSNQGRPGYEVLTPFVIDDGRWLLVNRGWMPFMGYREALPDVSLQDAGPLTLTGRIDALPVSGLDSGRAPPGEATGWPRRTSFPTLAELEQVLGRKLESRILLLDPQLPLGYLREWRPPGLDPSRHFSYAIQWWGFAAVLLVLYFGLNFRKVSR
jgi:surfeit locus 1 family protein